MFSGYFQGGSGCFQGVFPYALSGYALWSVIIFTKGVFSLKESLESLKSLESLESQEMVGLSLVFHSLGVLQNL